MVSASFPNRPFNLRDNVWFMDSDIPNNRSLVGWELWVDKRSYSPTQSSGRASRWMRLDGGFVHEYYGNGFNFVNGNNFLLASGTTWINHNADGTKSLLIEAAADFDILGATSLSVSIGLPTIPRASTATFVGSNTFEPGVTKTLNTNRASGNFTHTMQYAFGTTGWVTFAQGVGASTTWTPPESLLLEIPNNISGNGSIRTITYSGGTQIGITTTPFFITVPASKVPTFSTILHTEATSGVAANVGAYVRGISTLALQLTGAAGVSGSTIKSYKIELLSGSTVLQTLNSATGTSLPLNASGNLTLRGTVTDSRGRTAMKTVAIVVLAYSPPALTKVTAQRALSNGVVDIDEGTFLRVNLQVSVTSLVVGGTQRNALTYRIYTRVAGTTTWTLKSSATPAGTSFNSYVLLNTYAILQAYDVRVDVVDDFSTSTSIFVVPVAEIFMHWDGSRGVGFGKFRENGRLDVAGDVYLKPDLANNEKGALVPAADSAGIVHDRVPHHGTTAQRDEYFGIPAAGTPRITLANRRPMWFNTDFGWWESYYVSTGATGLTALGMVAGTAAGWYPIGEGPMIALIPSAQYTSTVANDPIKNWAQPGTSKSHSRGGTDWFSYDNTTGRISIVKAGRYRFRAKTQIANGSATVVCYIGTSWNTNLDGDYVQQNINYGSRMDLTATTRAAASSWVNFLSVLAQTAILNVGGNGTDENSGQFMVEYVGPAFTSY